MLRRLKVLGFIPIIVVTILMYMNYGTSVTFDQILSNIKSDVLGRRQYVQQGQQHFHRSILQELQDKTTPTQFGRICTKPMLNVKSIFYNRIHKTGSETLRDMIKTSSPKNGVAVKVIRQEEPENRFDTLEEKIAFLTNITAFTKENNKTIVMKHLVYLDFEKFQSFEYHPVYITLARDPFERFVSRYNYWRFRKDRPHNMTLEERTMSINKCIQTNHSECFHPNFTMMQVRYFCGDEPKCLEYSRGAVQIAKINIERNYITVGILERMRESLRVLEYLLPQFFANLTQVYKTWGKNRKAIVNHTFRKTRPGYQESITLEDRLKYDYEIYEFVKQRFYIQYKAIA